MITIEHFVVHNICGANKVPGIIRIKVLALKCTNVKWGIYYILIKFYVFQAFLSI